MHGKNLKNLGKRNAKGKLASGTHNLWLLDHSRPNIQRLQVSTHDSGPHFTRMSSTTDLLPRAGPTSHLEPGESGSSGNFGSLLHAPQNQEGVFQKGRESDYQEFLPGFWYRYVHIPCHIYMHICIDIYIHMYIHMYMYA